jgi:transcriptional antiterminator NusG
VTDPTDYPQRPAEEAAPGASDSAGGAPVWSGEESSAGEPRPAEAQNGSRPESPAPAPPAGAESEAPSAEAPPEGPAQSAESDDDDRYVPPIYEDLGRPEPTGHREWYIVKVQSNREESVKQALLRRVRIAGLEGFFGEVIVPTEKVVEFRGGKKRPVNRKLYPGYIVVHMELNEDTWFLVRETPGIGDFTGSAGKPTPMLPHEVERIVAKSEEKADEAPKLKIAFNIGDRVKINEGTFDNFEGEVESIDQANGRVTVMINIFGRSTPVQLEYWQVEPM